MRFRYLACAAFAALLLAPPAAAHVTLNPSEWEAGGFARFSIRVPNERDNAGTVEVSVQFPESVISARFQPVPGWERTIEMVTLDEPIVEEGEEPITERLASVTWSGGTIAPGEFQEFGVSFQVPETPG
ncbi:MAG: YcnI family protein, partial [Gaiellaceae bacterium]